MDKSKTENLKLMFRESLSTNEKLKEKGKDFLTKHLEMVFDINNVIYLLLLTNHRTYHGKHAIVFNRTLEDIAACEDEGRIRNLYTEKSENLLPEVYNNIYLDDIHKTRIINKLEFEFETVEYAMKLIGTQPNIMPCSIEYATKLKYNEKSAYIKAYTTLCVKKKMIDNINDSPHYVDTYSFNGVEYTVVSLINSINNELKPFTDKIINVIGSEIAAVKLAEEKHNIYQNNEKVLDGIDI
jgi:hypothetical protein